MPSLTWEIKRGAHLELQKIPEYISVTPPATHGGSAGLEVAMLQKRVVELCAKITPISNRQLIPENLLIARSLLPNATTPAFVEALPVDACNHACGWCFTSSSRKSSTIATALLHQDLEKLILGGTRSVLLSGGGEPLLFRPVNVKTRDFDGKTLVEWLALRGVCTGLITNGVLLDKFLDVNQHVIESMAFIRVSLDATNPLRYQALHQAKTEDHSLVLSSIRRAVELKGNSLTPAIGVSFVVDRAQNLNCELAALDAIDMLADDLGVDFVQLKHIHCENTRNADETMLDINAKVRSLSRRHHEWWIHRYFAPSAAKVCRVPAVAQVIRSDGQRSPCCHLQHLPLPKLHNSATSLFHVRGCNSLVCRYVSMNGVLEGLEVNTATLAASMRRLINSLERDGYHPYRLYPSSPDLA